MKRIAPLIAWMRRVYIAVHNRRLPARYVGANFKLGYWLPYTIASSYANAAEVGSGASVAFAWSPSPSSFDLARFLVLLAERMTSPLPAKAALNVILNAPSHCRVADYGSVARLFHNRVNFSVAWNAGDTERLCATVADAAGMERLRSELSASTAAPAVVAAEMIGRARARQFYANEARETLKSRGWAARYCALSPPPDWPADAIVRVLSDLNVSSPDWRFIILGTFPTIDVPAIASQIFIVPCYSGADLPTQLALAMEADAYFGVGDHYGAAALLAGKPATILESAADTSDIRIAALDRVRVIANTGVSAFAAELCRLIGEQQTVSNPTIAPAKPPQ
jgi:hypothetical protein